MVIRAPALGGDRPDHPPLTHRLNDQTAPATTDHQQLAASPDPKALHPDGFEVANTGQLEVAPALLSKAPTVKRPADPPAAGRRKQLTHLGVAPSPLPQDIRIQARRGRRRQHPVRVAGMGPTWSAWGATPAVVAGAPGRWAAGGHRATTAATSTAATTRLAARKATPNRRYHGGLGSSTITLLAAPLRQLRTDVPTTTALCADHEHNYRPRQLANLLLGTYSATSLLMSLWTLSRSSCRRETEKTALDSSDSTTDGSRRLF